MESHAKYTTMAEEKLKKSKTVYARETPYKISTDDGNVITARSWVKSMTSIGMPSIQYQPVAGDFKQLLKSSVVKIVDMQTNAIVYSPEMEKAIEKEERKKERSRLKKQAKKVATLEKAAAKAARAAAKAAKVARAAAKASAAAASASDSSASESEGEEEEA